MRESRKSLKWRTKIFLAVLVVSALTVLTPGETIRVQAATVTHEEGGITYSCDTDTKTAIITAADKNNIASTLEIPSSITVSAETYSVTSIGQDAFMACSNLQTVTIPDSVTSIGQNAFMACSNLQSVTIKGSVTSIGQDAFDGCSNLQSFTIPNSVTSIGQNAFAGCKKLETVTIPSGVTSIADGMFSGCSNLQSVIIKGSVTSIGLGAFRKCSSLQSFTIPESVTSIDNSAFYGCEKLETVTIPKGVTNIIGPTFMECSGLKTVTISEGVTSIGADAFNSCSSLETVTIPGSVTSIEQGAFLFCDNLKTVNFTGTQEQWDTLIGSITGNDILKSNNTTIETWEWVTTETTHKRIKSISGAVVVAEEAHEWENGVCKECGYTCAHQWNAATCKQARTCSYCGAVDGVANPDNHVGALQWVTTETTHKQVYGCCGAVVAAEEAHEWENKVCRECGYTCAHQWNAATCKQARACSYCGAVDGVANPDNHAGTLQWVTTETTHKQVYGCCGAVVVAEEAHEWENKVCRECGYVDTTVAAPIEYEILEGAGGSWTRNSQEGLRVRGSGAFAKFTGAKVDGTTLDAGAYTVAEGSTIITLKTAYLNTLSEGSHTLEIIWTDGTAHVNFTVAADTSGSTGSGNAGSTNAGNSTENTNAVEAAVKSPATGEEGSLYLPLAALLILAAGLVGAGAAGRRTVQR